MLTLVTGGTSYAQFSLPPEYIPKIEREKLELSDIEEVLQGIGIDIFRFGIPADSLKPHKVIFSYDEYAGDSVTVSDKIMLGVTYHYFPEEEGGPASSYCDKVRIYTSRLDDGKTRLGLGLVGGGYTHRELELKSGMPYGVRPFASQPFEEGKKIPLVMYGSFWKDDRGIIRFCGSRELTMDDEMLTSSPHYYIISVELVPE